MENRLQNYFREHPEDEPLPRHDDYVPPGLRLPAQPGLTLGEKAALVVLAAVAALIVFTAGCRCGYADGYLDGSRDARALHGR